MTKEDLYYRYFSEINEVYPRRFGQHDADRLRSRNGLCGGARRRDHRCDRALSDPDNTDAEFAVLVRSDLQGVGPGRQLLEKMIAYARAHGLTRLSGITMPNNRGMIALAQRLGFGIEVQLEDGIVSLTLPLQAADAQ